MKYGLIGYPLIHSFSKSLHNKLGNNDYELCELKKEDLDKFMNDKNFYGINVTIPYKQEVIKYLDHISDDAKNINAVNTIKNISGKLYGFNTDSLGFEAMLKYYKIDVYDKNILILGTGATSETVAYVLYKLKSKNIYKQNRAKEIYSCEYNKNTNKLELSNDSIYIGTKNDLYQKIQIIINTTPNGMYPHMDDELIVNMDEFINLEAVADVVYNPLRTKLLQKANDKKIKIASGLYMLVAQGFYANDIFFSEKNDVCDYKFKIENDNVTGLNNQLVEIYNEILNEKQNIVLIGMPSCGKSTIGKLLSSELNKKYIDTDFEIEKIINMPISEFINQQGEQKFREIEKQVVSDMSKYNGVVISTGGGVILDNENVERLKCNGKLFFINRSIENLKATDLRPLTSTLEKLKQIFDIRLPLYKKAADYEINGDLELDDKLEIIKNILK